MLVESWVFLSDLVPVGIDLLELPWEVWQAVEELFDDYDTKHQSLTIPSKSLYDELEGNALQNRVEEIILDDGSKKLCDLLKVGLRIFVQEAVFIEQSMEHTGVDFLLFDNLRLLEILQGHNQLLYPLINLVRLCREYMLEVLIGCLVNLLCALCGGHLLWKEDCILCHKVLNLHLTLH